MSFKNKVVIVTGAGSGMGESTVELFTNKGATVVAVDINADGLRGVAERCKQQGNTILQIVADVTNDDDAKRIIKETIDKYGKLDVLINAAGLIRAGTILDGTLIKSFDELINVNLRALMNLSTLAAPYLIETKGNIINISSAGDRHCSQPYTAYCVTKAGVTQFTKGAALELGPLGVRVNAICPSLVRTKLFDYVGHDDFDEIGKQYVLGKVAEPDEIADLILFLASDKAKSITGASYVIDNGYLLKNAC